VRAGPQPDAAIGPVTVPKQVEVIRRHLSDALARGARAVVGGVSSVRPPFVDPVVLVDVPEDALVMREETFGPVLPIIRVADGDEAVTRANASGYGLASAVYGKRRAGRLAAAVKAGMTSINAVQMVAAVPALPFGGVGSPASDGSTVRRGCASSPGSRPPPASASRCRSCSPVSSAQRP
jgi:acyl-CoA reductase-like NAD-dependent aldehyde dehydrogenase